MSDQNANEDNTEEQQHEAPAPATGVRTTPNTPPAPTDEGSSEADPAGIDNVNDSNPPA